MAIEGFSCTAFCYGQTGSGKTHTLTGPPDLVHTTLQFYRRNSLTFLHFSFLVENQIQVMIVMDWCFELFFISSSCFKNEKTLILY